MGQDYIIYKVAINDICKLGDGILVFFLWSSNRFIKCKNVFTKKNNVAKHSLIHFVRDTCISFSRFVQVLEYTIHYPELTIVLCNPEYLLYVEYTKL